MAGYKFHNPEGIYFVSFAVIHWMDVFTRKKYNEIVLETLRFCIKNKGMKIYAWCIMTNHVHLVFSVTPPHKPELVLGDFKRYTSRNIIKAIQHNRKESRRSWLMEKFRAAGEAGHNTTNHQFWRHDNMPIELTYHSIIKQKIDYTHNNPVKAGYVFVAHEYCYSSAIDYTGGKGLLEGVEVLDLRMRERIRA